MLHRVFLEYKIVEVASPINLFNYTGYDLLGGMAGRLLLGGSHGGGGGGGAVTPLSLLSLP